jgi:DNA-binding response OmpR family regulator
VCRRAARRRSEAGLSRDPDARDGRTDRILELAERERLHDVGHGIEAARVRARRVDARADDRDFLALEAENLSGGQRPRIGGLDEENVDCLRVEAQGLAVPGERGLVPEPRRHVRQKSPHLGVRLADEDPRHGFIFDEPRANVGAIWYGNGMKRGRVLVVDDDADIRNLVRELLERQGYDVTEGANGRDGLRAFYATTPDVVILDVGMPEMDGFETLERIRDLSDVPVLMLTARAAELEKVRGLKAGADDYVTKPFGRQEFLARVEAMLRRARPREEGPTTYADELVAVDFAQRSVAVSGHPVTLTPLEFRLLAAFIRHPNQVLAHDQLLELVWGDSLAASRDQVKLYVGYLRRKLEAAGGDASAIETVRGFGYRYRPPAASRPGT